MKRVLFIEGNRNGYGPEQCGRTLTIRELIEALEEQAEEVGEDAEVFLRNDNGYTYGSITTGNMNRGAYNNHETRILEDWEDYSELEDEDDEEEEE